MTRRSGRAGIGAGTAAGKRAGITAARLPDGLTVILREMRQAPVVSVW